MDEKLSGLDWNALLQKAEETVKKLEEEGQFFTNDDPMTGIEEMRGSEHAYYEKRMEDARKILEEASALLGDGR